MRVHSPRLAEEDSTLGWDCCSAVEQMFERRKSRSSRMAALEPLRKLHLVADKDYVLGAHAHWLV